LIGPGPSQGVCAGIGLASALGIAHVKTNFMFTDGIDITPTYLCFTISLVVSHQDVSAMKYVGVLTVTSSMTA
jgi:hypothetical protein